MPSKIILTDSFRKDAKKLSKKYKSLGKDIKSVVSELENDPFLGDRIGPQSYKIRFAIKSKGRGKSGGGRLIAYINISVENRIEGNGTNIYLIAAYDKSDVDSIPKHIVNDRIKNIILSEEE